jgi:hypothetical protein
LQIYFLKNQQMLGLWQACKELKVVLPLLVLAFVIVISSPIALVL